jgi:hypothetical protein
MTNQRTATLHLQLANYTHQPPTQGFLLPACLDIARHNSLALTSTYFRLPIPTRLMFDSRRSVGKCCWLWPVRSIAATEYNIQKSNPIPATGRGGLWGCEMSRIPTFYRQWTHRWRLGCQPYTPAALYTHKSSGPHFCYMLSNPGAMAWLKTLCCFFAVAQHLPHLMAKLFRF